jgi:hypothetical protein
LVIDLKVYQRKGLRRTITQKDALMRSISIQEFERDPKACIAEASRPISAEKSAALDRLSKIMEKGYDMGSIWTGRDELYDRDVWVQIC